eukprot:1742063-Rhodomonas_salina.1
MSRKERSTSDCEPVALSRGSAMRSRRRAASVSSGTMFQNVSASSQPHAAIPAPANGPVRLRYCVSARINRTVTDVPVVAKAWIEQSSDGSGRHHTVFAATDDCRKNDIAHGVVD